RVREALVSAFTAVTVAPTITAPLASRASPLMAPKVWADAMELPHRTQPRTANRRHTSVLNLVILGPLPLALGKVSLRTTRNRLPGGRVCKIDRLEVKAFRVSGLLAVS